MKRIFRLIIISFGLFATSPFAYSQTGLQNINQEQLDSLYSMFPRVDGKIEIEEVIHLDSTFTTKVLYKNAKLFYTNEFKKAQAVIQYDDSVEGRIIGKGDFKVEAEQLQFMTLTSETRYVTFSVEIFCKDGRYRYRVYDFSSHYLRIIHGNAYNPDRTFQGENSLDQEFTSIKKSTTKKLDRNLFLKTLNYMMYIPKLIKKDMAKRDTLSNSDF